MSYNRIILTNHARERMAVRGVTQQMIELVVKNPDRTEYESDGDSEFIKTVQGRQIHVVCKPLPDEGAWLVKTTFVRGEQDPHPILKWLITMVTRYFNSR